VLAIQGKVTLLPYLQSSTSMHNGKGGSLLDYPGVDQMLKLQWGSMVDRIWCNTGSCGPVRGHKRGDYIFLDSSLTCSYTSPSRPSL
jgi:hypothetical protein